MPCSPETLKGERHDEDRDEEQAFTAEEEAPAERQLDHLERRKRGPSGATHHAMRLPATPEVDQAPPAGGHGGSQGEAETRPERQRGGNRHRDRHGREIDPLGNTLWQHPIRYSLGAGVRIQPGWRGDERKTGGPRLALAAIAGHAGFPTRSAALVSASPSCTSVGRSRRQAAPDSAERPVASMPLTSAVGEG